MTRYLFLLIALIVFNVQLSNAQQDTLRILFLGNSFTNANNLPSVFEQLAISAGKKVYVEENSPGGYTLSGHVQNPISLQKIANGHWDFVIMQEQSQIPSWIPDRDTLMYPYAIALDSLIHAANVCSRSLFFMTWAHKNGDLGLPVGSDTYEGMQQRLRSGYKTIADSLDAALAPCGWAWRTVRQQFPDIELYASDGYHPSFSGTYLAACTFFACIFQQSVAGNPYMPNLGHADAIALQTIASQTVLDSLNVWNTGLYDPETNAAFNFVQNGAQFYFINQSTKAVNYEWQFGDGNHSQLQHPSYTYQDTGYFSVQLISSNDCSADTITQQVYIAGSNGLVRLENAELSIFPNPTRGNIYLQSAVAIQKLSIVNIFGELLFQLDTNKNKLQMDTHFLAKGVYWIKIELANGTQQIKKILVL
jgi:hypothetical protein